MEQLKLVAQALGIALDSGVEKILEALGDLKKRADGATLWEARAKDNLAKLEGGAEVVKENRELKADAFINAQKAQFKFTAAECSVLKAMYLSGPEGEKAVKDLADARSDQEYLTRITALKGVVETPVSPLAEVNGRAQELMAKAKSEGRILSLGEAQGEVLKADGALEARYNAAMVPGMPTPSGGVR